MKSATAIHFWKHQLTVVGDQGFLVVVEQDLDNVEELLVVVVTLADHFVPVLTMNDAIFSVTVMIDQVNHLVCSLQLIH
jgi:hypothetical protein